MSKNNVIFTSIEGHLQDLKMDRQSRQIHLSPDKGSFEPSVDFICGFVATMPEHVWKIGSPMPEGTVECTRDELAERLPHFVQNNLGTHTAKELFEMIEREIPGDVKFSYSTQTLIAANQHQIAMFKNAEATAQGSVS